MAGEWGLGICGPSTHSCHGEGLALLEASLVDIYAETHGHGMRAAVRRAAMLLLKLSTAAPDILEKPHQPLTLVFPKIRSRTLMATLRANNPFLKSEQRFETFKRSNFTKFLYHKTLKNYCIVE